MVTGSLELGEVLRIANLVVSSGALLMQGRRFVRADLIITHGSVRTMEPGAPRAEAIAIAGDKIMAVGGNEEITELAGPGTEQINAAGCTVMPGIVDAHNHVRLGSNPAAVSLAGAASLEEIRGRISGHLRAHPGIDWIEGEGWNYAAVPGGKPTASMIDEVCAGRRLAVFLRRAYGLAQHRGAAALGGVGGPSRAALRHC